MSLRRCNSTLPCLFDSNKFLAARMVRKEGISHPATPNKALYALEHFRRFGPKSPELHVRQTEGLVHAANSLSGELKDWFMPPHSIRPCGKLLPPSGPT